MHYNKLDKYIIMQFVSINEFVVWNNESVGKCLLKYT